MSNILLKLLELEKRIIILYYTKMQLHIYVNVYIELNSSSHKLLYIIKIIHVCSDTTRVIAIRNMYYY